MSATRLVLFVEGSLCETKKFATAGEMAAYLDGLRYGRRIGGGGSCWTIKSTGDYAEELAELVENECLDADETAPVARFLSGEAEDVK